MEFGVPPANYSQAEAFQYALEEIRALFKPLPGMEVGLHSHEEVAQYLNNLRMRKKPFTTATIKRWCKTRRFPHTKIGPNKFFTTNLFVYAWLWTFRKFTPKALGSIS